ncbi:MAG: glycosyltransferase [Bacteroidales bacterium]|nr:glycosyltransferase [Bacteroidales bacterium]
MYFSIIVPTFNRPDEVDELMASLTHQSYREFELILADGTPDESLVKIIDKYRSGLTIQHLHRPYLGISDSRNLGCQHAKGQYFIFLDSDCVLPENYLQNVLKGLTDNGFDAFGGPDAANESFTPLQKAISYSMTSILTTGGIRGKKKHVGQFHPRGFNMGISREVFEKTNGYSSLKCAEDIEFSIRIINLGFKTGLILEAYVYHKRRTTFKAFFKQVYRFGAARINIYKLYSNELKITHFFPAAFLIAFLLLLLIPIVSKTLFLVGLALFILYFLLIFVGSTIKNKSPKVGLLSIFAVITQFSGYGSGFIANFVQLLVLKREKSLV